jgi:putative FmdB family regulatory protein
MPIYEYACTNCGERTEARQSFSDPPLEECPNCGGKLRKLYSPVGIVFKGSGFYSTDAKKSASSGSSKSGDSKGETKGDSKPDSGSKTDSKSSTTESKGSSEKSA